MRKPWFRASTNTWFVEVGGKQIALGKDPRFKSPPKEKPKAPPPEIQKAYLKVMQRQAEPEDRTLSFCIEQYLASIEDCVENTRRRAKLFLERFLADAGDLKVTKLKPHHLSDHIKGKDWKPNTVRAVMATVNACLNYCEREGWIDKNPLRGRVRLPQIERREVIMEASDRKRLIEAATEPLKTYLRFLEGTGCRPQEAREALVEKLDLEKGVLMVPNKTRRKTGLKERPVFLSSAMIELCRKAKGVREEGWLFLNNWGKQWKRSAVVARMDRLGKTLKIEEGAIAYAYRHGFLSEGVNERNINPAILAIQAGHSDVRMLLKHYLHHDAQAMRRHLDGFDSKES